MRTDLALDRIAYGADGLIPVIAQEARTGEVLMLAWADREALAKTQSTGYLHYHSRSRQQLWKKGETSGHVQRLVSWTLDCDQDAVLALVHQEGPACHTGQETCFQEGGAVPPAPQPQRLARRIRSRAGSGDKTSHTARLLGDANLRLKKIGEEATELVLALRGEGAERVASEAADVIYHLLVACQAAGVPWSQIAQELTRREA